MIDLQLDETGEPIFDNGDLVGITNNDDMASQQVYITLQSIQGEYDLDKNMGLLQDNLYGRHITPDYVRKDIIDAVEDQCSLVDSVDDVDIDFDRESRIMNVTVTYVTTDSTTGQASVNVTGGGD